MSHVSSLAVCVSVLTVRRLSPRGRVRRPELGVLRLCGQHAASRPQGPEEQQTHLRGQSV